MSLFGPSAPKTVTSAHSVREYNAAMHRLYDDPDTADLGIVCSDGQVLRAHSLVLWPRSIVLEEMCSGGSGENTKTKITLDEDCSLIQRMLAYCYALSYNNRRYKTDPVDTNMDTLHQHACMYNMGHKYNLPGLKLEAIKNFDKASFSASELVEILAFVYSSTPETDCGLRDAVVNRGFNNWPTLAKETNMEDVIVKNPKWAVDIIAKTSKPQAPPSFPLFSGTGFAGTGGPSGFSFG